MVYALTGINTSGRIAERSVLAALGWQPGDRLSVTAIPDRAATLQADADGRLIISPRQRITLPALLRHRCGIDGTVFLIADPEAGVVIIRTLAWLDHALADSDVRRPP